MQRRQGCCGRSEPRRDRKRLGTVVRGLFVLQRRYRTLGAATREPQNVCNGDDRCPKMSVVILPGGMR